MSKSIPRNTFVIVADGTQANVYRNVANNGALSLKLLERVTPTDLPDDGPSGVVPPEMSRSDIDESTFAKQLAQYLHVCVVSKRVDALVLAADPKTLGQMRACMHNEVSDRLVKSVDKTLTNSPVSDIEKTLA